MISNILTSACEEQNLFYTPFIPLQTTSVFWDDSPSLKQFLNMIISDNICVTTDGIYILLHKIMEDDIWIKCNWLTKSGKIVKKHYCVGKININNEIT